MSLCPSTVRSSRAVVLQRIGSFAQRLTSHSAEPANAPSSELRRDATHARREQHKRLFWFRRPWLLFRLIQLLLLFQSWFVGLLVIFFPAEELDWTTAQTVLIFSPPLITALVFAPLVLPIFTLIRYVGDFALEKMIEPHHAHEAPELVDLLNDGE